MASPFSLIDPNSPQMSAFMARNPLSIFSQMVKRNDPNAPAGDVVGSNNAGGLASPATNISGPPNRGGFNRPGPAVFSPNTRPRPGPGMRQPMGFGDSGNQAGQPMFMGGSIPSFAAGGMMSPQGTPIRPGSPIPTDEPQMGASAPAPVNGAQIEAEANKFMQAHPDVAQKVQGVLTVAMQSGELTPDELNMMVQLAKTALANPASYPQLRQFAIQNGMGTEQDIPQHMDQGLLYVILVAGKAMQSAGSRTPAPGAGNAMVGQAPAATQGGILPEYSEGGMTGDKPHIAQLHAREYVIPEEALLYHGKKTFDKLVEQARTPTDGTQQS